MSDNKPPFHHTALSERVRAMQGENRLMRKKTKKKTVIVRDKGMEITMERRRLARGRTTSCSR